MSSFKPKNAMPATKQDQAVKVLEKARAVAAVHTEQDVLRIRRLADERRSVCNPPIPARLDMRTEIVSCCRVCQPVEHGNCLWRMGLLQEQHRPDVWGCRAIKADFTPTREEAPACGMAMPVIVMQEVAESLANEGVDFAERRDIRTVASLLAPRVTGVLLQGPDGSALSWIGTDNGLALLGAGPVPGATDGDVQAESAPQVEQEQHCGDCGRGDDVPCDCPSSQPVEG